jgi:ABC-type multidrug transport system ATPase subunit
VLLLDKPTSGLDVTTAAKLLAALRTLAAARGGLTIIASIHAPSEAVYAAFDHLLVLSRGRLVYGGPPGGAAAWLRRAYMGAVAATGVAPGGAADALLSVSGAVVVSEVAHKARGRGTQGRGIAEAGGRAPVIASGARALGLAPRGCPLARC